MNALTTFNFGNTNQLRTITDEAGNPWFVLADVCDVLELSNPSMVASRLDEDERAKLNLGRQGESTIINESGLYAVIIRSDKPEAKRFRKWVTGEVLPAIRKTGNYSKEDQRLTPNQHASLAIEGLRRNIEKETAILRQLESAFGQYEPEFRLQTDHEKQVLAMFGFRSNYDNQLFLLKNPMATTQVAVKLGYDKPDAKVVRAVGIALKKCGYTSKSVKINGSAVRAYMMPIPIH
jgi:prophage antirepressor-like protein